MATPPTEWVPKAASGHHYEKLVYEPATAHLQSAFKLKEGDESGLYNNVAAFEFTGDGTPINVKFQNASGRPTIVHLTEVDRAEIDNMIIALKKDAPQVKQDNEDEAGQQGDVDGEGSSDKRGKRGKRGDGVFRDSRAKQFAGDAFSDLEGVAVTDNNTGPTDFVDLAAQGNSSQAFTDSADSANATSTDQAGATSTDQAEATSTDQAEATSTDQAEATSTDQAGATSTDQAEATSTDQAEATSTDQAEATSTDQAGATSTDQAEATSTDQVNGHNTQNPSGNQERQFRTDYPNPQPRDRFIGVTHFAHVVDQDLASPNNPLLVGKVYGSHNRSDEIYGLDNGMGSDYKFSLEDARVDYRRKQGVAMAWEKPGKACPILNIKTQICAAGEQDFRSYIKLIYTMTLPKEQSDTKLADVEGFRVTVMYRASDICKGIVVCKPLQKLEDVPEAMRKHVQHNAPELKSDSKHDAHLLSFVSLPQDANIWSENLYTGTDFGPFSDFIKQLGNMTARPHRVDLVLTNASAIPIAVENFVNMINSPLEKDNMDPFIEFWEQKRNPKVMGVRATGLERKDRKNVPNLYIPARLTFATVMEAITIYTISAKDEDTELLAEQVTQQDDVHVRVLLVPRGYDLQDQSSQQGGHQLGLEVNQNFIAAIIDTSQSGNPENPDSSSTFLLNHLREGDKVQLTFPHLDPKCEEAWNGEVVAPLTFTSPDDLVVALHRPRAKEDGTASGLDPSTLEHAIHLKDIQGLDDAVERLNKVKVYPARLSCSTDEKQLKRRMNTILSLQEQIIREGGPSKSAAATICLGNRFDLLPRTDLFEGVDATIVKDFFTDKLTGDQVRASELFKRAPYGFVLIHGPAGCGKTKLMSLFCQTHLKQLVSEPLKTSGDEQSNVIRTPLRGLMATPVNTNAEALTTKFREDLTIISKDAVVARLYSRSTLKKMQRREADTQRSNTVEDDDETNATSVIQSFYDLRDEVEQLVTLNNAFGGHLYKTLGQTFRRDFAPDKRVTKTGHLHSTAIYTLLGCDAVSANDIDTTSAAFSPQLLSRLREIFTYSEGGRKVMSEFKDVFRIYTNQEDKPDLEQQKALGHAFYAAHSWLGSHCDLIVTTNQQAMQYQGFNVKHFMMDEAARAEPTDSLCWVWYPNAVSRIFAGDPNQSKPQPEGNPATNSFHMQLYLSEFSRLIAAGIPSLELMEQQRYNSDIANVISPLYGNRLNTASHLDTTAGTQKFKRFIGTICDRKDKATGLPCGPAAVLFSCPETSTTKVGMHKSIYNPKLAHAVWMMYKKLIQGCKDDSGNILVEGYDQSQVGIIVQYTGSLKFHQEVALRGGFSDAIITTNLRSQGQQYEVVIYVVDAVERFEFSSESNRVCGGITRAQHGLIILADWDGLVKKHGKKFTTKPLGTVMDRCIDAHSFFGGKDSVLAKKAVNIVSATITAHEKHQSQREVELLPYETPAQAEMPGLEDKGNNDFASEWDFDQEESKEKKVDENEEKKVDENEEKKVDENEEKKVDENEEKGFVPDDSANGAGKVDW